jgi:hypothetical protein
VIVSLSNAVGVPEADGATVLIQPNGLPGDAHWRPDLTSYYARIRVYELGASWSQVTTQGVLHVLTPKVSASATPTVVEDPLEVGLSASVEVSDWVETAAIPFESSASILVIVRIPNEAFQGPDGGKTTAVRVYVTLADGRVSHHSLLKNEAILTGNFDAADVLDGVPTVGVST